MRFYFLTAILLLVPSMAAAGPRPSDFAYGIPLSLQEGGAVYRFTLPLEVYETVTRDDLADIRIFNGAGMEVPHVLKQPKTKDMNTEISKALPFFPLYSKKDGSEKNGLSVRIEKGKDGAIIDVRSDDAERNPERKISGYLLDAGGEKNPIRELDITLHTKEENFIATVSVQSSEDLSHWQIIVPRATLARMQYGGHEINIKRIQLPVQVFKYLQISWPAGHDGIEVKKILAVEGGREPERKRTWTAITGKIGADEPKAGASKKGLAAFEYDSASRFTIDRVRFRFSEKNSLVKVALFSKSDDKANWSIRQSGILYDLHFDNIHLVQNTLPVSLTSDRYWRVETAENTYGNTEYIPVVELGWLPHELVFVARGDGPFMLAYGSARLEESNSNDSSPEFLTKIINDNGEKLIKEAALLSKTLLGGPNQLVPEPPPLPWKKWLLWGVLVIGVGIVALMALNLVKAMKTVRTFLIVSLVVAGIPFFLSCVGGGEDNSVKNGNDNGDNNKVQTAELPVLKVGDTWTWKTISAGIQGNMVVKITGEEMTDGKAVYVADTPWDSRTGRGKGTEKIDKGNMAIIRV